jgi:hypothetical protein
MELSRAEDAVAALNEELAFEPPETNVVTEDRLHVFLVVRKELQPLYERWSEMEAELDESGDTESFDAAKEVLGVLGDGFSTQLEILRRHAMSPAEFTWLDEVVYDEWLTAGSSAADADSRLAEATKGDLEVLEDARRRHGDSPGLQAVEERLRQRLDSLTAPRQGDLESIPEATSELLWAHRDQITELVLDRSSPYLDLLKGGTGEVRVNVSDEGTQVDVGDPADP